MSKYYKYIELKSRLIYLHHQKELGVDVDKEIEDTTTEFAMLIKEPNFFEDWDREEWLKALKKYFRIED